MNDTRNSAEIAADMLKARGSHSGDMLFSEMAGAMREISRRLDRLEEAEAPRLFAPARAIERVESGLRELSSRVLKLEEAGAADSGQPPADEVAAAGDDHAMLEAVRALGVATSPDARAMIIAALQQASSRSAPTERHRIALMEVEQLADLMARHLGPHTVDRLFAEMSL